MDRLFEGSSERSAVPSSQENVVHVDFVAARKAREAGWRNLMHNFIHFPTRHPWAYRMVLATCLLLLSLCVI